MDTELAELQTNCCCCTCCELHTGQFINSAIAEIKAIQKHLPAVEHAASKEQRRCQASREATPKRVLTAFGKNAAWLVPAYTLLAGGREPSVVVNTIDKYENKVYTLPKHLDEKVARLHLDKIGVELESLTPEQAKYIDVPIEGPYKPDYYRY